MKNLNPLARCATKDLAMEKCKIMTYQLATFSPLYDVGSHMQPR